jgi:glycosyltransferase involved in cell wall biosynthesis
MRVLVITAAQRLPDLTTLYAHLAEQLDLDIRHLDKAEQLNLKRNLADTDLSRYARILLDVPFRRITHQGEFLRSLQGLVFYEEDACQNYIASSSRFGAFSRFYAGLVAPRVLVTGARLAERLRQEGVDAHFLSKGYDSASLYAEAQTRDIELGFIGRLASVEYAERHRLLSQLAACEPLQFLRTSPGEAYRQMLNRIQMFVSADVGLGEYMAKNFEAMACGCLLLAWRQPDEERALGLRDGEHLLLFSSLSELRAHIQRLRADPLRRARIAAAGQQWAMAQRGYPIMAEQLCAHLRATVPAGGQSQQVSRWRRLWPF